MCGLDEEKDTRIHAWSRVLGKSVSYDFVLLNIALLTQHRWTDRFAVSITALKHIATCMGLYSYAALVCCPQLVIQLFRQPDWDPQ